MTSPASEIVISTWTVPVAFIFLAVGVYSGLTSVITRLCKSLSETCSKSCGEKVEGGGGGGGGAECSSNRPRSSVPGGRLANLGLRWRKGLRTSAESMLIAGRLVIRFLAPVVEGPSGARNLCGNSLNRRT